jgi:hypothetical protein
LGPLRVMGHGTGLWLGGMSVVRWRKAAHLTARLEPESRTGGLSGSRVFRVNRHATERGLAGAGRPSSELVSGPLGGLGLHDRHPVPSTAIR